MGRQSPRFLARQPFRWSPSGLAVDSEDPSRIDIHALAREAIHEATAESLLELFLDTADFSARPKYELPVFSRIFDKRALERIRIGQLKDPEKVTAWIHDRSRDNSPRPTNGPLSTKAFHRLTAERRFNRGEGIADADTRRIYLPNPGPDVLGILALRASEDQTPVIRRLIFKHLKSDNTIGLRLNVVQFQLEFHIPYFAWRVNRPLQTDLRSDSPLREAINLDFLSESRTGKAIPSKEEYLYEAQLSVCVTGRNLSVWTAFCLADTWFDEPDPNNEIHLEFYQDVDDADPTSCAMDALSGGSLTADDRTITDPREYFLQIVKFQMLRVTEEWKFISYQLDEHVDTHLRGSHISLPRRDTSLGTAKDESNAVVKSEFWVKRTSDMLNSLIDTLSKSVGSWDDFVTRDWDRLIYEAHKKVVKQISLTMWEITEQMDELKHVLKELKSLKSEIDNFMGKLSLHIAVDGNRTVPLQYWNVTVLQVISPMALAGSMMQAGLGFGNNYICFFVLSAVITIFTSGLQPMLTWYQRTFYGQGKVPLEPEKASQEDDLPEPLKRTGFSPPTHPAHVYQRHPRLPIGDKEFEMV